MHPNTSVELANSRRYKFYTAFLSLGGVVAMVVDHGGRGR